MDPGRYNQQGGADEPYHGRARSLECLEPPYQIVQTCWRCTWITLLSSEACTEACYVVVGRRVSFFGRHLASSAHPPLRSPSSRRCSAQSRSSGLDPPGSCGESSSTCDSCRGRLMVFGGSTHHLLSAKPLLLSSPLGKTSALLSCRQNLSSPIGNTSLLSELRLNLGGHGRNVGGLAP